jgi:hypothetical protein
MEDKLYAEFVRAYREWVEAFRHVDVAVSGSLPIWKTGPRTQAWLAYVEARDTYLSASATSPKQG